MFSELLQFSKNILGFTNYMGIEYTKICSPLTVQECDLEKSLPFPGSQNLHLRKYALLVVFKCSKISSQSETENTGLYLQTLSWPRLPAGFWEAVVGGLLDWLSAV